MVNESWEDRELNESTANFSHSASVPKRGAVVARNQAEAGLAAQEWQECSVVMQPNDLRSLTVVGGGEGIGVTWAENTNVFHTRAKKLFDVIWLDDKVTLPSTAWTAAFLRGLTEMLSDDGVIVVHASPKKRNNCQADASLIAECLGPPVQAVNDTRSIYLNKPHQDASNQDSLLNWWMSDYASALLDLCREVELHDYLALQEDTFVQEFLGDRIVPDRIHDIQLNSGLSNAPESVAQTVQEYIASMAYLFHGIGYKASVISEIIRTEMGAESPIHYLDIGGANGALAGEMLLQNRVHVETARTHELLLKYLPLARRIYLAHRARFEERFIYSLGSMNDFAFDVDYNVVSFIGALYLSGPQNREGVVQRAFDGLRPGGLMVVHENLRDNRPVPDHEFMFDQTELTQLLSGLAEPKCYHTLTGRQLELETVGGKTVFWTVRKPS